MNLSHARQVLDFQEIRRVPLTAVLDRLGVLNDLRRAGSASLVGRCPICRAKSRKAFSVSLNRVPQLWRCFAPEHDRGGDALSFLAEFERIEVKEAAARIASWFAVRERSQGSSQQTQPRRTSMTEATANRPTHKVYAASKREGQKDFLTRIGSAWPFTYQGNKSGLNIQLTAMPIGDRIVLFEYDEEPEADEAPAEKKSNGRKK